MPKPLLIVISGPPCSGKTTLGLHLAKEFHLPCIGRDDLKESLFDSLGWSDREWSRRLGRASYQLLYLIIEKLVSAQVTCIVESNFNAQDATRRFLDIRQRYGFHTLQFLCVTEGGVLMRRFKERAQSGHRHPGHVEDTQQEEQNAVLLEGRIAPLDIGGKVIEVDSTDFSKIDYDNLFRAVRDCLPGTVWPDKS